MGDSDFWGLAASLALLGLAVILLSRVTVTLDERLTAAEDGIRYLHDHTAATETEERPS